MIIRRPGLLSHWLLAIALAVVAARTASAQSLLQTIDLNTWTGVPVSIVQPPLPQPAPGFSLTSLAFNPVTSTLYAADNATTNVYIIDATTGTVTSAVYTNGLFSTVDIGSQAVPGTGPTVVLVNPATNRWLFTSQTGGAQFIGTTFDEAVAARAQQGGGAWDPVTGNVYGANGLALFATNNVKFLFAGAGTCNAAAVNLMTSRVYAACPGGVAIYDGVTISQANVNTSTPAIGRALFGAQPGGIAVNPNTNRIYAAGMTSPNSVDVLDASTYSVLTSIPGLPDQSSDRLVSGYIALTLPRPVAVNTVTNTIFVLNSVSSTISVIDGKSNTLVSTIAVPVPDGAVFSQPVPPFTQLFEIKPGNTYYDTSTVTLNALGGAISMAVNEASNQLYVASVNGTISVYSLPAATSPAAFSVNGVIRDAQGAPVAGVTVNAGSATAVTDATGLFVLTGLTAGTYAVAPASKAFAFAPASQSVSVKNQNIGGLAFQANPPIVPVSYTLSPWTTIGAGVTTTGTITLNQPAPSGGAVVALSASDNKAAKFPSSVTVSAGQSTASFPVQANGVSAPVDVALTAAYNGGTASTTVTVAPGDKISITSVAYSQSTQILTVNATDSSSLAILTVTNSSNGQPMGTMVNLGNGNFALQLQATTVPGSVNVASNLGNKTGQGIKIIP